METRRYWDKREQDFEEMKKNPPTRIERINALVRKANNLDSDNPKAAAQARKEAAALEAEIQAEEDQRWTKKYTQEMRQKWNAAVRNPANQAHGKALIGKIEREAGFGIETLKRHIRRHNL